MTEHLIPQSASAPGVPGFFGPTPKERFLRNPGGNGLICQRVDCAHWCYTYDRQGDFIYGKENHQQGYILYLGRPTGQAGPPQPTGQFPHQRTLLLGVQAVLCLPGGRVPSPKTGEHQRQAPDQLCPLDAGERQVRIHHQDGPGGRPVLPRQDEPAQVSVTHQ